MFLLLLVFSWITDLYHGCAPFFSADVKLDTELSQYDKQALKPLDVPEHECMRGDGRSRFPSKNKLI